MTEAPAADVQSPDPRRHQRGAEHRAQHREQEQRTVIPPAQPYGKATNGFDPRQIGWGVIKQRLIRGLDSRELGQAYEKTVAPQKKYADRHAQHAAFVALVKPVFDPEYARIQEIFDAREVAGKAYVDFLEKL